MECENENAMLEDSNQIQESAIPCETATEIGVENAEILEKMENAEVIASNQKDSESETTPNGGVIVEAHTDDEDKNINKQTRVTLEATNSSAENTILQQEEAEEMEHTDVIKEIKPSEGSLPLDENNMEESTTSNECHQADVPNSSAELCAQENTKGSVEADLQEATASTTVSSQVDAQPNESEIGAAPKQSETTEINSNLQKISSESQMAKKRESSNNATLNENLSSKTTELEELMETQLPDSSIKGKLPTGSSLGLLAQYNSDSDRDSNADDADRHDDDVIEVPLEGNKDYRNKVVEIESQSESESSSSDDSDVEYLSTIRKEIEKTIDFDDDEDDDEDGADGAMGSNKKKKQTQMRVKGELLLEDLPPIQDLHITVPEEECIELGRVHSIIDQLLLVSVIPDSLLLDLDTVLFLDKGKRVLGEVFDVLGQVADPMYCVRFNSHKEIEEKGIKIGDTVYVAPKTQYTQFVILSSLMKLRGSDASWENDVEPPPRYLDYSDDEQEREARAQLRNKDRPNDHEDPIKRVRGNDKDDAATALSAMPSGSQSINTQRSGRFNRSRGGPTRQPYQQYQRNQPQSNTPHSGSWHSNYRQPYSSYHNANMMPQQTCPIPAPYPYYSTGPYTPPPMSPIPSPGPLPMFVLNPLAVAPPRGMLNNRPQYHASQQPRRTTTHSPPPAPPGLD